MDEGSKNGSEGKGWRNSLYARATIFMVLGCGSLLGAVAAISFISVEESVAALLDERIHLARTAGGLLEHSFQVELKRLGSRIAPVLAKPMDGDVAARLAVVVAGEYQNTVFEEGAFVLDKEGGLLLAVPSGDSEIEGVFETGELSRQALEIEGAVASPLERLSGGMRPVLVLLAPVRTGSGKILGFIGGLLHPASNNVLQVLEQAGRGGRTELDLVDSRGVVVASTGLDGLFRHGDHNSVLTQALRSHQEVKSRCHSCHELEDAQVERETHVLAFAPLPTLALGLAVHEPESAALAPAFELFRRLMVLGLAFVLLFLLFAGLSVRSVVAPVTRLTVGVRRLETSSRLEPLPRFGNNEVGELAHALEKWRGRMFDSLATAQSHRHALVQETEATRQHLEVLQDIAAHGTLDVEIPDVVDRVLDRTLTFLRVPTGVLRVAYRQQSVTARRGVAVEQATALLAEADAQLAPTPEPPSAGPGAFRSVELAPSEPRGTLPGAQAATVVAEHGLSVTCVLADERGPVDVDERWLASLLQHIAMSATNRLFRDEVRQSQERHAQYLHRVLKAQEDERRRVARELHDTLVQDLAALRLYIERLSNDRQSNGLQAKLVELEERVQEMLGAARRILLDLRLSVLETLGFLAALQWHLERLERVHSVRGVLSVDGEEIEPKYEISVTLFRIFQEALQNIVQHASAEHAFVTVVFRQDEIELMVEDDGTGFSPTMIADRGTSAGGRGLGLLGMEERARLLGGTFSISSRADEGTTVNVTVPLVARADAES